MGVIAGAHGIKGQVRVKSFAAQPRAIGNYGPLSDPAGRRYTLTLSGGTDHMLIAAIEGVADREQAKRLKGTELFVPREALPATADDEFYHADLVGLEARLQDGTVFGRVRAVHDFGAGNSLEIERAQGEVLVPFTRAAVPTVDIANGFLLVIPPIGLLGD